MPRNRNRKRPKNDTKITSSMSSIAWYSEAQSTIVYRPLSQNLDFSTFPYLVKIVYNHLKSVAIRHRSGDPPFPPYCAFLHVCTGVLNSVILESSKPYGLQYYDYKCKAFHILLPAPIVDYIYHVVETTTVFDQRVTVNIPKVAIPRDYSPSAPEIPGGSFGPVDEHSHNVYECYVSPYVTRRLVEATRDADEDWEPLPGHLKPDGGIPNENLLGYEKIEKLDPEQRKLLNQSELFSAGKMETRLHWSDHLARNVNDLMRSMQYFYEMKTVFPYRDEGYFRKTEGMVGFVEARDFGYNNATHLAPLPCNMGSWQKVSRLTTNIQICFGLKRKRTAWAPGLCYTLENKEAPTGWMEHINDNFEMKGIFEAEHIQKENSQLQCANVETGVIDRAIFWRRPKNDTKGASFMNSIGLIPVTPPRMVYRQLSQNLDFSKFPYLVHSVYEFLKSMVRRSRYRAYPFPPYCAFLHVCTGVLNSAILESFKPRELQYYDYQSEAFHILLPAPIVEYISHVIETTTVFDQTVSVNVPEVAIPRDYSPSAPEIPAGSFGPVDEHSHNVYECYVSPYVTRRLVEATRDADEDWEPLPGHLKPDGGIPNENLLGYEKIEKLNPEQRKLLNQSGLFPAGEMETRLHWSDHLANNVNVVMTGMQYFYEMKSVIPYGGPTRFRETEGMVGFVEARNDGCNNATYLAPLHCNMGSWQKVSSLTIHIQVCFGLKRKRTDKAPGLCYTLENEEAPAGWMEHINDNFEMKGIFQTKYHLKENSQFQCANFDTDKIDRFSLETCIDHYELQCPYYSSDDDDDEEWSE